MLLIKRSQVETITNRFRFKNQFNAHTITFLQRCIFETR